MRVVSHIGKIVGGGGCGGKNIEKIEKHRKNSMGLVVKNTGLESRL